MNLTMAKTLPKYLLGKYQLVGTVTFSILFALVFLNIYIPFSETAWFGLGDSVTFLLTLSFAAIAIFILIISRTLMYKSRSLFEMTYLLYTIWCIIEIVTICAIYTHLTTDMTYTSENSWIVFWRSLLYGSIALGIPYLISGMYFAIIDKNNTIRLMNFENVVTDDPPQAESSMKKITLFDNSGTLKLSISPENLYYIESDDNYIKVWYTNSKGELTKYMLRCRLKTVEDSFKGTDLVRCNRKYIVNISKVSLLHKENDGYILDLCKEDIPPIPVTKTYLDAVLGHFTESQPLMDILE